MAQRTAFLNSDAKGFNKDFHHTWIDNYMLKQPGVMFSNYSTKPEFALGNGQIAGGKAIIRCTRTTGSFAGEEILASFESTTTENISTSGDKKIFIEIPEVYVNDSTAITDALTQGVNLGVGRIVSDSNYPSHSNYIPLWEITGGDWQNAVDRRPEILRRGKPNTLSYFGGNGEEERIDIDNSSLNKYLMSNGAGVAPSWEEGGGGGGATTVENFKRTFTADEDLLAKSMFGVVATPTLTNVNDYLDFGRTTVQNVFFCAYLNGEDFSSLTLNLAGYNSPADSLSVRLETLDSNGKPSGTLIDVGAYGTVTLSSATLADVTINLAGTVSGLAAHTKIAVVLSRSGSYSDSNCYRMGILKNTSNRITQLYISYEGSYSSISNSGCVACDGFATEAVMQSTSSNGISPIGYSETGAIAGNDFTGILQGTVDYTGATTGTKYYLGSTGTLDTTGDIQVGVGLENGVLSINVGGGGGKRTYDAVVAADGGDYTTVGAALTAGKKSIFVKAGTYTEGSWNCSNKNVYIEGEYGATITFTGGSTQYIKLSASYDFYMSGLNITVSDLKLFNSVTYTTHLFTVRNCYITIATSSLSFDVFTGKTGYNIGGSSDYLGWGATPTNGFYECTFKQTDVTGRINFGGSSNYVNIINCTFITDGGLNLNKRTTLRGCLISAGWISGTLLAFDSYMNVANGFGYSGTADSTLTIACFHNCYFNLENISTGNTKITVSGVTSGNVFDLNKKAITFEIKSSFIGNECNDLVDLNINTTTDSVIGNYFDGSASTTTVTITEAIACNNNYFVGAILLGASAGSTARICFNNNYCLSADGVTINCSKGTICGNRFGADEGGVSALKAVTVVSSSKNNNISNNYCNNIVLASGSAGNIVSCNRGTSSSPVSDSGTNNHVLNNFGLES